MSTTAKGIVDIKRKALPDKYEYIFFKHSGAEYVAVPSNYGIPWWKRAKMNDILRVAIREHFKLIEFSSLG